MFATTVLGLSLTVFWLILFIIVWVAIAFWPATVAKRKGYSFIGFFILSLIFFFLSLLIAYLLPDKNKKAAVAAEPDSDQPD